MKAEKLIDNLQKHFRSEVEIYCGGKTYSIKSIYEYKKGGKKYVVLAATQPKNLDSIKG